MSILSDRIHLIERLAKGWEIFKQNLLGKIGLTLMIIFALMALASFFTPLLGPTYDPMTGVDPQISHATGPSWRHWLGTDFIGRDILTQLLEGAKIAFMVGLSAAFIQSGVVSLFRGMLGSQNITLNACSLQSLSPNTEA